MHGQCSARKAGEAFPQAALRWPAVMKISPRWGDQQAVFSRQDAILQALDELPVRKITDIFTDINTDKLTTTDFLFHPIKHF
jgi:hypothetical protein